MTLKLAEFVFRSWYYFRLGYGTYLAFLVGFAGNIVAIYYLMIKNLPFLYPVFPRFHMFVTILLLLIIPIGVLIGWLHMKRTLAFPTEMSISVEANPYNYRVVPGKEKEILAPFWALTIRALRRILEKENMLSLQERNEFENLATKIERLLEGETIGKPRQRKLQDA